MTPVLTGHVVYVLVIGLLLTGSLTALRLAGAGAHAGEPQERSSLALRVALTAQSACLGLLLLLVLWQVAVAR